MTISPTLKLKSLSPSEIQTFIKEEIDKKSLPSRLFKSVNNAVDIMVSTVRSLYKSLESQDCQTRQDTMCSLFEYCNQLRSDSNLFEIASTIKNVTLPIIKNIRVIQDEIDSNEDNEEYKKSLQEEIEKCEQLSAVILNYNVQNLDWIFRMIARFMKDHFESFSTERLLWSFCEKYFENEELKTFSERVKEKTSFEFQIDYKYAFPYNASIPINAEILIDIDGTSFTDCVEVSTLHFFYMTQPSDPKMIDEYWDKIDSPLKEKIKNFFHLQGPKRANNENVITRQIWAEIVSRIPGMIYKKKTDEKLQLNDVEIKAGWFNYLKAIAHLKNEKNIWNELCKCIKIFSENKKITSEMKKTTCDCFAKLAGEKLQSIQWIDKDYYEGIRDMEDGTFDLLGRIRCSFIDAPEKIDFIMMDGHGFVEWMDE